MIPREAELQVLLRDKLNFLKTQLEETHFGGLTKDLQVIEIAIDDVQFYIEELKKQGF